MNNMLTMKKLKSYCLSNTRTKRSLVCSEINKKHQDFDATYFETLISND